MKVPPAGSSGMTNNTVPDPLLSGGVSEDEWVIDRLLLMANPRGFACFIQLNAVLSRAAEVVGICTFTFEDPVTYNLRRGARVYESVLTLCASLVLYWDSSIVMLSMNVLSDPDCLGVNIFTFGFGRSATT